MGLINELQESIKNEYSIDILRKSKILCSKLGLNKYDKWKENMEWIDFEVKGYFDNKDKIPSYRIFKKSVVYLDFIAEEMIYNTIRKQRHRIPTGICFDFPMMESISNIKNYILQIDDKKEVILFEDYKEVTDELFNAYVGFSSFNGIYPRILEKRSGILISSIQLKSIEDSVKDIILNWTCDLEKNGIEDCDSFSNKDKELAKNITFNINYYQINNINKGDVNNEHKSKEQY